MDGYGEAIHRMSLKNLNDVKRLDIPGHRKIDKLVYDPPFLYWINRERKDDVVIERYNLNNSDSITEPTMITHFANNVTGGWKCLVHYVDVLKLSKYCGVKVLVVTYHVLTVPILFLCSALTATTINNQPNAFWYNETDSYIYRYNGTMTRRYLMWRAPGAMIAFLGYTRKDCKNYKVIFITHMLLSVVMCVPG